MRKPSFLEASDFFNESLFRNWFHHFPKDFSEMDKEFEKMVNKHAQFLDSLHSEPSSASKQLQEGSSSLTEKEPEPKILNEISTKYPGAKIKNFGSWEPKEFKTAHGKGRVIGPVGYYVSWSYKDEGTKASDNDITKTTNSK